MNKKRDKKTKIDTKIHVLETACQLFSKHGYRRVSMRMISDTAKVSQGTMHYHFGSKEKIYYEVIKMAYESDEPLTYKKLLELEPFVLESDAGKAYAIQRLVQNYFRRHIFFNESWKRHIILQEVMDPSPMFQKLNEEIFSVEAACMEEFYYKLKPHGKSTEAFLWSRFPDAQGVYYLLSWASMQAQYSQDYLQELSQRVINTTTRQMIEMLRLPVPEMLQQLD